MKTETKKNRTIIKKCDCQHEIQDEIYGKQMRVMNSCKKGEKVRCTVCGKEHKPHL